MSQPGISEGIAYVWHLAIKLDFEKWVGFCRGENEVDNRKGIPSKIKSI